jgi:choice-of-anchor A domain-containing protein
VGYLSGGALGDGGSGEGQPPSNCRLQAPCTTPIPATATRTTAPATATRTAATTGTPTRTPTRTAVPAGTATRTATPTNTPAAGACVENPLGPAAGFNLFVLGDVTQSGSDTEGRMAAGGIARLTNYSVGDRLPNSRGTRDDLIVGGNLIFNSGQVSNGNVVYGGTGTLTNVGLPNGTARRGTVIDFAAAGQTLRANAAALAGYAANGSTSVQYNQITLTGTDPQVNIFTVSGAGLASATGVTVRVQANSLVLVNINGTADRMQNFGFSINGTDRTHILYNFYQATSLTLSGIGVEGSVLAPNAAVTFNSGQLNGTLVAASLTGGGQNNLALLDTCVP